MKKVNRVFFVCMCLIFCISCFQINRNEKLLAVNSAKSMIVIEANSNRILKSHNVHTIRANASTTKIATFLTILKHCKDFDQVVEVDDRAIGVTGTSIYLKKGEKLTVKELLYGMMLVSGNDAATALALHICDSVEAFAHLMTMEAKKCGALNSVFKNPHGLDEPGHHTTAYDLSQITRECYKYPLFEDIVSTQNIKIPDSTKNGYRFLKNKNKLLLSLDGCNGVKTGFTNDAGRCLVSSANKDGLHIICVVLNCGPMFEESSAHINECLSNYKMVSLLPANQVVKNLSVLNSNTTEVKVYTKQSFDYPLTLEEEQKIKFIYDLPTTIKAPVIKDQIIGKLKIYLDNHLLFSEKIYTIESVNSNRIEDNFKRVISNW